MKHTKHKAFTLVELIVVVTILAILATIGFVSYSSYLTGVRDTNRLAQLVSIHDGLELYRTQKDLPLPDENVEVSVNGNLIAYQGTAGSNTLETIDFTKGGVDPRDGTYFSYYLTKDKKHYQLLGFLEEEANITSSIVQETQAVEYENRVPTVYGRKLGILTNSENTPIEQTGADVDITSGTTGYIAHMTDTETLSGSTIQSINPKASCLRIKQLAGGSSDGVYEINPTNAENAEFDVYCDMTTDGGGWTYATMLADSTTGNLFDTGNTDKIISLTNNTSTKGTLSDMWIEDSDKDIFIQCFSSDSTYENYETPLIIYDYLYSDINNLEKDVKAGTTFSSNVLQGSWGNKKINYNALYVGSSNPNSFYLGNNSPNEIVFFLAGSTILYMNSSCYSTSPCDIPTGSSTIPLSLTTYCMTAIR